MFQFGPEGGFLFFWSKGVKAWYNWIAFFVWSASFNAWNFVHQSFDDYQLRIATHTSTICDMSALKVRGNLDGSTKTQGVIFPPCLIVFMEFGLLWWLWQKSITSSAFAPALCIDVGPLQSVSIYWSWSPMFFTFGTSCRRKSSPESLLELLEPFDISGQVDCRTFRCWGPSCRWTSLYLRHLNWISSIRHEDGKSHFLKIEWTKQG